LAIRIDLTGKQPWDDNPQVMSCGFRKGLDRHLELELFKSMRGGASRPLGVQSVETRWAQVGIRDAFAEAGPHWGTGSCRLLPWRGSRPSPAAPCPGSSGGTRAWDLRELKINVLRRHGNAEDSTQPLINVGVSPFSRSVMG
jgi:hypothetical protein